LQGAAYPEAPSASQRTPTGGNPRAGAVTHPRCNPTDRPKLPARKGETFTETGVEQRDFMEDPGRRWSRKGYRVV